MAGAGTAAAFARNGRLDILAANPLGQALYSPAFTTAARPVNLARFCLLNPAAETVYPDWSDAADTTVNLLRTEAGRVRYNKAPAPTRAWTTRTAASTPLLLH